MLGIKLSNSPSPSNLFNYETHHVMLSIYNLFNNKSEKQLIELLEEANTWHPNIRFDYKIGKSLSFLDVLLTNDNGILSTSVYHKSPSELCVVPFISDHPRHVFGNVIQTTLARAIRYSSNLDAFNHERIQNKLTLLYNG